VHSRLLEILAEKREEVKKLKKRGLPGKSEKYFPKKDFKNAIFNPKRVTLIAEIKFASPSARVIREKTDPLTIGEAYQQAGASAISVLTDEKFFGGSLNFLPSLKKGLTIPVLRKDFIIDDIQVRESVLFGADAVLLIARLLSNLQLRDLLQACREEALTPLVEVHERSDLERVLDCHPPIIGINNRDLHSFEVSLETSIKLAPMIPRGHVIVSESGIENKEDIQLLKQKGIHSVLVGTTLMKSRDILRKTKELAEV